MTESLSDFDKALAIQPTMEAHIQRALALRDSGGTPKRCEHSTKL